VYKGTHKTQTIENHESFLQLDRHSDISWDEFSSPVICSTKALINDACDYAAVINISCTLISSGKAVML